MEYAFFVGEPGEVDKKPVELRRIKPSGMGELKIPISFREDGIEAVSFAKGYHTWPAELEVRHAKATSGDVVHKVPSQLPLKLAGGSRLYEAAVVHETLEGGRRLFKAYHKSHPDFLERRRAFLNNHVYLVLSHKPRESITSREALKLVDLEEWKISCGNNDWASKAVLSYGDGDHPDREYLTIDKLKQDWLKERRGEVSMGYDFKPSWKGGVSVVLRGGFNPSIKSIEFGGDFERCSFDAVQVHFSHPDFHESIPCELIVMNRNFYDAVNDPERAGKVLEAAGL